jgi:hypothetical protein
MKNEAYIKAENNRRQHEDFQLLAILTLLVIKY